MGHFAGKFQQNGYIPILTDKEYMGKQLRIAR